MVSKTINPVGTVSKLSVSVLVADKVIPAKDKEPEKTTPRSAEEIKAVESMVASALGLDTKRGDKIEVTSMPFTETVEAEGSESKITSTLYQFMPLIKYGLLALGGVLLYLLMVKPLMKTLKEDVTKHYKTVEQMEAEQARGTDGAGGGAAAPGVPKDTLKKIQKDVAADPAFGAHVLKSWIQDRS